MSDFRALPSVEQLLTSPAGEALIGEFGRPLVLEAVRSTLMEAREQIRAGMAAPEGASAILAQSRRMLDAWLEPTLVPVINATGVILHTNLGRAPLSRAALNSIEAVGRGYSTLEYDLASGARGSRQIHAEALLTRLTGAEAALVVNNNAAAVLLALSALGKRKKAVIARSQLVEIGGGFRVPDVMAQSGAKLVEVGTTNRVHLQDYEEALKAGATLVMRVHPSNFRMIGFTTEPEAREIAALAHRYGATVIDDLGSGTLLATERYGLAHELTIQEALGAGADVVTFSGDKLLGGPQAGIIIGKQELLGKIKKHPLARALRADKLRLAALSATLTHYLTDEAERELPVWRMMAATPASLRERALRWQARLEMGEVVEGQSTVGGGSLPGEELPTWLLSLRAARPAKMAAALRAGQPAVIARISEDQLLLDPRTVLEEQEDHLLGAVRAYFTETLEGAKK